MWNETSLSKRLGIKYPIIQGAFGGGPSSVELVCAVSRSGGLGSYGMQSLEPKHMAETAESIRASLASQHSPFALNLWIAKPAEFGDINEEKSGATLDMLRPYYEELGIEPASPPLRLIPDYEEQIEMMLEIKPPVFSFVFGIPSADVLERCRARGIVTLGTATTVAEAQALEAAGVDCIVASSFEAGGHKGAFLRPAEESLVGGMALIPQVVDSVGIPVAAAGGIADARGIAAAMALGADGVQIGTAFLACRESAASSLHRRTLSEPMARSTILTRGFSGRLARGVHNAFADAMIREDELVSPYPMQGWLVSRIGKAANEQKRPELAALSAGQSAGLIRHQCVSELMNELVRETPKVFDKLNKKCDDHQND